jgi:hypothetical protein
MTGALLDRPAWLFSEATGDAAASARRPGGDRVTLEELLNATLQAARTNGSIECPVCHARMRSTRAGADCGGCGSRLS